MLTSDPGLIVFWERSTCPMQNYVKHSAIFYKIVDQIPVAENICWHNLIYYYRQPHNSLVRAKNPRQLWKRQRSVLVYHPGLGPPPNTETSSPCLILKCQLISIHVKTHAKSCICCSQSMKEWSNQKNVVRTVGRHFAVVTPCTFASHGMR